MHYLVLIVITLSFTNFVYSQECDTIILDNPSFEDIKVGNNTPKGWKSCLENKIGNDEVLSFVLPKKKIDGTSLLGVTQESLDGESFLGLIALDKEINGNIQQQLAKPLRKNHCYSFSVYLCRNEASVQSGLSRNPMHRLNFNLPVIFRAWGGNLFVCHKKQLLLSSEPIINTQWKRYDFKFKAESKMYFIQMEAYCDNTLDWPNAGNLLVDNASDIIEIDCEELDDY